MCENKRELVIATRNKNKKREIVSILDGLDFKFYSLDDFDCVPEIEEDGHTFKENAVKKAVETARWTKKMTLADDSGLEVDALGGQPGVYSARFAGPEQNDEANIEKLLSLLKVVPAERRKARFRCAVALAGLQGVIATAEGVCEGRVAFEKRGTHGFGYDPVFIVPEYNKTFAELGKEIKDKISHRARALKAAKEIILREYPGGP